MSELWIIEAPGKARMLEGILARIGLDARVQATKGHLLQMPKELSPVGIDERFHEFKREPRDMDLYRRIRDMAKEADHIIIATDADSEGDVIAWDVAEAISDIHPTPQRVRLRGMDDESVQEAIELAGPVLKQDAIAGRTRAIVDRLIGSTFSRDGIGVGRVSTAVLGAVARDKPSVWRLKLSAPSKDGGRPWLAETDVQAPLTKEIADRILDFDLPALATKNQETVTTTPAHMGEIMVRAAERLEMSPKETATAMQRTYEAGQMSYPRAGSKGMSRIAAKKLQNAFKKHGYSFDDNAVADKDEKEVHDAPYPIGKVDVSLNPERQGADQGIRTMVARDLVRTGQKFKRERAITAKLESFLVQQGFSPEVAAHIAGLDWHRDTGPRYPGQESWVDPELVQRRTDAVVLETMLKTGLGRPSTWANHVESFLSRGLVDDELSLTNKGKEWLAASPVELTDPRLSVAIEKACETQNEKMFSDPEREPWEILAQAIIKKLPANIQGPIIAATNAESAKPRKDFKALVEPGIDIDLVAAEAELRRAYRPEGF